MVKKKKSLHKKGIDKKIHNKFDPKVRKMDYQDIQLTKASTVAFIFFLIVVWPGLLSQVLRVHWGMWLALAVLFAIRPMNRIFK